MEFKLDTLTPIELDLVRSLEEGTIFEPEGSSTRPQPVVRAGIIRNLLRNVYKELTPDPKGLRLRNVRIQGRLDLNYLDSPIPLDFDQCDLPGGLTADRAHLFKLSLRGLNIYRAAVNKAVLSLRSLHVAELDLKGTTLVNLQGPALDADKLIVDSNATLEKLTAWCGRSEKGVSMVDATIGGQLNLRGAELTNKTGPALLADGIMVSSNALLDKDFVARGNGPVGAVSLVGATIGGQLNLRGAELVNETGPALFADKLAISSDALFDGGLFAHGHDARGAVRLTGATVNGQLLLGGATIINPAGYALIADGITVSSSAFLNEGFKSYGKNITGTVRLLGAIVNGQLLLNGAAIINPIGPALVADGITIGSSTFLNEGFIAYGNHAEGAVRFLGGTINGQLNLSGAKLVNPAGPALVADGLAVASDAFLNEEFIAHGEGPDGAIRLVEANIGRQFSLRNAKLTNTTGPALCASEITVQAGIFFDERFSAQGNDAQGAVQLTGATIHGQLNLRGANLINQNGPALVADGVNIGSNAYLDRGFSPHGHGPRGVIRMAGATIGGQLVLHGVKLTDYTSTALFAPRLTVKEDAYIDLAPDEQISGQPPAPGRKKSKKPNHGKNNAAMVLSGANIGSTLEISPRTLKNVRIARSWDITGLTYRSLTTDTAENWLEFLRSGTRNYSYQPYQQFATIAHAQGDERLSQSALIAQRNDQLDKNRKKDGLLTRRQRFGLWVLRLTVGYGYKTGWALVWLFCLVMIAISTTLHYGLEGAMVLRQPEESKAGDPGDPCRPLELWMLGLETIPLTPFVSSVADRCVIADTAQGGIYLTVAILFKLLAWALVTLFVAGYTNIVRKPGP